MSYISKIGYTENWRYVWDLFGDVRKLFIVKNCQCVRISCLILSCVMWFILICLSKIITCDYFEHSLNWFYLHMKSTKSTFSDVKNLFIMKICHFVQISCLILSYMIWFISICSSDKITCDYFEHSLSRIFCWHSLNRILCLFDKIACDYFEHK